MASISCNKILANTSKNLSKELFSLVQFVLVQIPLALASTILYSMIIVVMAFLWPLEWFADFLPGKPGDENGS